MLNIYQRSQLLLGESVLQLMAQKRIIIFGIGGVGSWCAEGLLRTGFVHLTLVDFDEICESNLNRQLHATTNTIGKRKVDVMRQRLLDINPNADIIAIDKCFDETTCFDFELNQYDYIVDAIDMIHSKVLLIKMATATQAFFVSSMGAARRIDPSFVKVAEFWKVNVCPLARHLRQLMRNDRPSRKFLCVYSDEIPFPNEGSEQNVSLNANGSLVHITAVFGMTLAGLIIRDVQEKSKN